MLGTELPATLVFFSRKASACSGLARSDFLRNKPIISRWQQPTD